MVVENALRYLILGLALLAAGCASDTETLPGLLVLEFKNCEGRLRAGELPTRVARARCETGETKAMLKKSSLDYPYGDLVALLTAKRMELAKRLDSGTITAAEAEREYNQFHSQFVRELKVREDRYKTKAEPFEFNFCKIVNGYLLCILPPRQYEYERDHKKIFAVCDQREEAGELKTFEAVIRCNGENAGEWSIRNGMINADLMKLAVKYAVTLAVQVDAGEITKPQFQDRVIDFQRQSEEEKGLRQRLRIAGDLDWQNRKCEYEAARLICSSP